MPDDDAAEARRLADLLDETYADVPGRVTLPRAAAEMLRRLAARVAGGREAADAGSPGG